MSAPYAPSRARSIRAQLAVEPAERVADGGEEGRDRLLAAGEVAVGGRALAAERGPGELQEGGGGGAERVGGERLEGVGEPRPRVLHERALLRGAGSLRRERRLELRDPHRPLGRAPCIAAPGEPAEGGAEREAEREEEESGRVHARKRTPSVCPLRSFDEVLVAATSAPRALKAAPDWSDSVNVNEPEPDLESGAGSGGWFTGSDQPSCVV